MLVLWIQTLRRLKAQIAVTSSANTLQQPSQQQHLTAGRVPAELLCYPRASKPRAARTGRRLLRQASGMTLPSAGEAVPGVPGPRSGGTLGSHSSRALSRQPGTGAPVKMGLQGAWGRGGQGRPTAAYICSQQSHRGQGSRSPHRRGSQSRRGGLRRCLRA